MTFSLNIDCSKMSKAWNKFIFQSRDHAFTVPLKSLGIGSLKSKQLSDLPLIENVSMIGAVYRRFRGIPKPLNGLFWRDAETLRRSLEVADEEGYPLAKKLKISIVNIAYGRDFLTKDPKQIIPANLIVSSFVYNPPQYTDELEKECAKILDESFPENSSTSIYHHDPLAWHDAACQAGAHLITTLKKSYDDDEISSIHFNGPNVKLLTTINDVQIGNQKGYVLEALTCHP